MHPRGPRAQASWRSPPALSTGSSCHLFLATFHVPLGTWPSRWPQALPWVEFLFPLCRFSIPCGNCPLLNYSQLLFRQKIWSHSFPCCRLPPPTAQAPAPSFPASCGGLRSGLRAQPPLLCRPPPDGGASGLIRIVLLLCPDLQWFPISLKIEEKVLIVPKRPSQICPPPPQGYSSLMSTPCPHPLLLWPHLLWPRRPPCCLSDRLGSLLPRGLGCSSPMCSLLYFKYFLKYQFFNE